MEEVKLELKEAGIHIIKFGNIPTDKEPKPLVVSGNIDSVANFIASRRNEVISTKSIILVDESEGTITLIVDEKDPFNTKIVGKLALHPDFVKWGINTEKVYNSLDLSNMIKMNRHMLASLSGAMELVKVFQNLKFKVEKEVQLSDDKRGNKTNLQQQVVMDMSIPESFTLNIPIFKGIPNMNFEVEICLNAETLNIQLVSPMANDMVQNLKRTLIGDQLKEIASFTLVEVPVLFV